jgi:hypothetical protein
LVIGPPLGAAKKEISDAFNALISGGVAPAAGASVVIGGVRADGSPVPAAFDAVTVKE